MKRKTAKELLAESFRELAETKNIDRITVKDITENCGYSTATFYRQFRDKYDLIAWDYARCTEEILNQSGSDACDWSRAVLDGAYRYQRERDYLSNLLLHTNGHDSFVQYMTEINCSEAIKYVCRATGSGKLDPKTEMYIRLYCMGTTCLTCEWILGRYDVTPEELAEIYARSVPGPLQELLAGGKHV